MIIVIYIMPLKLGVREIHIVYVVKNNQVLGRATHTIVSINSTLRNDVGLGLFVDIRGFQITEVVISFYILYFILHASIT